MGLYNREPKIFVSIDKDSGNFSTKNGEKHLFTSISGRFTKIYETVSEYNGEPIHKLVVDLVDGKDTYAVQLGFDSGAGRSLMNSLLTVERLGGTLDLSSYKKNGEKFNKFYATYNGQKIEWKYQPADIPKKKIETLKSGKVVEDDTEVVEFWKNVFNTLVEKFKDTSFDHLQVEVNSEDLGGEDIPF